VAISERTRQDVLEQLGIAPERVTTVHLGVDTAQFAAPDAATTRAILDRLKLPERFFVYVGSDHYRKNQELLFRAWLRVADEIPDALVLVGKAMYSETFKRVSAEVQSRGLDARVLWRDEVTDAELPALYRASTALVTPSLYEGFGMTLLEAMSAGAPVAASRNGAHEEVGLDACLYFDPRDEGDLAARLVELSRDEALRERMRARGLARAAEMSWSAMARATMDVYRRVLSLA
jgi:glycosyltransferase involved in cell wall biosynthesis